MKLPSSASFSHDGSGDHSHVRHKQSAGSGWTKSHGLEGDGLLTLLFHHLWKKNKSFQSCPGVKLPDTVVYEHNFPRAWYTYDFKNGEISKRSGRFLDTHHIFQSFSKTNGVNDICAQYLFTSEGEDGPATSVEFMTPKELAHFLNHRKVRPDGILQRFLPAADCNSQVQVIWSPRISLIQRRVNKCRMHDRNIPAYQRCVTYDGPAHYTEEGLCSERTKNQILRICSSIVDHFYSTEHKSISRFVLYFKVASIPKQAAADGHDTLWLLWASSLRIGSTVKYRHKMQRPLSLSPNMTADVSMERRGTVLADKLAEMDRLAQDLTVGVFATSSPARSRSRSPRRSRSPASPATSASDEVRRATRPRPSSALAGRSLGGKRGAERDPYRRPTSAASARVSSAHRRTTRKIPAPPATARASTRPSVSSPSDAKTLTPQPPGKKSPATAFIPNDPTVGAEDSVDGDEEWWSITPEISERYTDLKSKARSVHTFIDDLIYSLYSHILRKRTDPLFTRIPEHVRDVFLGFGEDKLALILAGVLRMVPYDAAAEVDFAVPEEYADGEEVWYAVCETTPPFGMQAIEAHAVLSKVVELETVELKKLAVERQQQRREALELESQDRALKTAKSRLEQPTQRKTGTGPRRSWRAQQPG
eukprot:TRINITY_DN2555_c0_g2_i1.p1 TRINITY_DN2555_c0_g2~~TRINITY_DN2555_c0_g2_i1.p1  ORF type:complete len:648 (+),score=185.27 TRINITY_DN2555_c0_g2_i1:114-2057(+)